jgi:hypothetical protein
LTGTGRRATFATLVVVALLGGAVAIGCGGDGDSNVGEVKTFPKPETGGPLLGGEPKHSETAEEEEEGDHKLAEPGGERAARRQIVAVADRFLAAASRGDVKAMCSLFAARQLSKANRRSGCLAFFRQATARTQSPTPLRVTSVDFTEGGEAARVNLRGLGQQMEMEYVDGEWVVEEALGY